MRARTLLLVTALVSAMLGALVAYLVLTVPNDLQANALMRQARQDLTAGKKENAREALSRIVQQYPRTDAAAAAIVALARIADDDRARLGREVDALEQQTRRQSVAITDLRRQIELVKSAQAKPPEVKPAPPKPAPKKPAPKRPARRTRRR